MRLSRLLLAAFVCLMFGVNTHATAQDCVAKDQEIAFLKEKGPAVQTKKIEPGPESAAFARTVEAPFPDTYSYVISWIDEQQYTVAVVSVFDDHNCLATRVRLPKEMVRDFIGAAT